MMKLVTSSKIYTCIVLFLQINVKQFFFMLNILKGQIYQISAVFVHVQYIEYSKVFESKN